MARAAGRGAPMRIRKGRWMLGWALGRRSRHGAAGPGAGWRAATVGLAALAVSVGVVVASAAPADPRPAAASSASAAALPAAPRSAHRAQQGPIGYDLAATWRGFARPSRVTMGPDGRFHVLDDDGVQRIAPDGAVEARFWANAAREITGDDLGNVYGLREKSVFKFTADGVRWTRQIDGFPHPIAIERLSYLSSIAWDLPHRRVTVPWDVELTNERGFTEQGSVQDGDDFKFPEHVYWDHQFALGHRYALNRTLRQVEVYQSRVPNPVQTIPLPVAAERMAVGPDGSVFVLSRRRWIHRVDANGDILGVLDAVDLEPSREPYPVTDLAVDAAGRVAVAGPGDNQVPLSPPGAQVDPHAGLSPDEGLRCQIVVNKGAAPTFLQLGEQTQVTLTLGGGCPTGDNPGSWL